ncbi:MAG TPA: serine hydrolase, partial [Opitutaceae bacterium]|nr:serine hydrolase [Opitutaceae bacterium]
PVLKFFPDYAPAEPNENLRALRVKDLLTMSTGQHPDGIETFHLEDPGDLVAKFFSIPLEHKPGTFFHYNSGATFLLSVIVQRLTGQTVRDYLVPRLFEPLGIAPPKWDETAQGFSYGASGLHIRTEDIARFGQLYLQKGEWQGKQLLPKSWIEEATAKQVSNGSDPTGNWDQGYGYQFWRCPHDLYRADGAFGQYCIVIDQHDTVLAMTCGTADMATVMNTAWEILLPAFRDSPLPADPEAHAALLAKLASLTVPPQLGEARSEVAASVIGKRYAFPENMLGLVAITLDSIGADGVGSFTFDWNGVKEHYTAGPGEWRRGGAFLFPNGPTPVAASGAWTDANSYALKLCAYQTPFTITQRLRFTDKQLIVDLEINVAFGNRSLPTMTGTAE